MPKDMTLVFFVVLFWIDLFKSAFSEVLPVLSLLSPLVHSLSKPFADPFASMLEQYQADQTNGYSEKILEHD
jgi:hypothetical protein